MSAQSLHLIRCELKPGALLRFASAQGIVRADDEDAGYMLHAWLRAMFGSLAPKPFRLTGTLATGPTPLLGYTPHPADELLAHAQETAEPHAFAVLRADSLVSKLMPTTWRTTRQLKLDVVACPMSRKDAQEKDIFLRALDRLGDNAGDRASIYANWLTRQLASGFEIESVRLAGFKRVRSVRRVHGPEQGRRKLSRIECPQASFSVIGRIADPDAFNCLLSRGIGRHRAFGYGMVLVSPAE